MVIPIFSITSLKSISLPVDLPGGPATLSRADRVQLVSEMGNCSNVPGPK